MNYSIFGLSMLALGAGTAYASSVTLDHVSANPGATVAPETSESRTTNILKKFQEDTEITDAKMKADAGSLSIISLRFNLSYYGPSPTNLNALDQPNPDSVVAPTATAISGSVGGRYRLNPSTTISLYAGVSDLYAFHPRQNLDINSPTLSYDKIFRLAGIQMLSSPSLTFVTQKVYRNAGEVAGLNYNLSGVYNLGESRFAIGSDNVIGYYFFGRGYQAHDGKVRRMNLSLAPFVKYNWSDQLNLNTSTGFNLYNLRRDRPLTSYDSRTVTQKLGLGYAFNRDVYISPYLMFYPSRPRISETTLNLLTSFSLL
jgi:hypothetical protein